MIFVLELPAAAEPRAWFAFDDADLLRKLAAQDLPLLQRTQAALQTDEPRELARAALAARGECRLYWSEAEATGAFERSADPLWQGSRLARPLGVARAARRDGSAGR